MFHWPIRSTKETTGDYRPYFRYKEKTPGVAKVDWALIADREDKSNELNTSHLAFYRSLVQLRRENKALLTSNLEYIHEDHTNKVLAYQRWYKELILFLFSNLSRCRADSGERVVVILNLSNSFLGMKSFDKFNSCGIFPYLQEIIGCQTCQRTVAGTNGPSIPMLQRTMLKSFLIWVDTRGKFLFWPMKTDSLEQQIRITSTTQERMLLRSLIKNNDPIELCYASSTNYSRKTHNSDGHYIRFTTGGIMIPSLLYGNDFTSVVTLPPSDLFHFLVWKSFLAFIVSPVVEFHYRCFKWIVLSIIKVCSITWLNSRYSWVYLYVVESRGRFFSVHWQRWSKYFPLLYVNQDRKRKIYWNYKPLASTNSLTRDK